MDHSDVMRLEAVEKYVLGELPAHLRDQFEEHYFDCAECAAEVKHLMTFMTASRLLLQEAPRTKEAPPEKHTERVGWFAWLRPMIAVPTMVALAAIVIFQNVVTIPSLKPRGAMEGAAVAFSSSYHLQGTTRGDGTSQIIVGAKESFALDFDFTPAAMYPSYTGRIADGKGATLLTFAIGGGMANQELHVVVPGGKVPPGECAVVIAGEGSNSGGPSAQEVQRIPFTLVYRP